MIELSGQTVVTRSTSTYRTELSFCQQITSLSSIVAVSMELSDFKRVCNIELPLHRRFILLVKKKIYEILLLNRSER